MTAVNAALAFDESAKALVPVENLSTQIEKFHECPEFKKFVLGIDGSVVSVPVTYSDGRIDETSSYKMTLSCSGEYENDRGIIVVSIVDLTHVDDVGPWKSERPLECNTKVSLHSTGMGNFVVHISYGEKPSYIEEIRPDGVIEALGKGILDAIGEVCEVNPQALAKLGSKPLALTV